MGYARNTVLSYTRSLGVLLLGLGALLLNMQRLVEPVSAQQAMAIQVRPSVETEAVPGDADDPAIWIHPTDPAQSIIITAAKYGGLRVHDLSGKLIQHITNGYFVNVDLRYNFSLAGQPTALVVASNQTYDSTSRTYQLNIYRVNPQTRMLEDVAAGRIGVDLEVYGLCMYHSPASGKYYAFVNQFSRSNPGTYQQWELQATADGKVTVSKVRSFVVGSEAEGCVADDQLGVLYVAESIPDSSNLAARGIWKYGAEPTAGDTRTQIDSFASGRFSTEIEGLTLYYTSQGTGYLILSNQTNNTFVVYRREGSNDYVMTFQIGGTSTIDAVEYSDGVDVTNFPLGPSFPYGVFIAHDERNINGDVRDPANFKLVPWEQIANAGFPALAIDPSWDPRRVGQDPTASPTPSPTPSPIPTPRTYTFSAAADARVEEGSSDTNYGQDEELRARGGGAVLDIRSYLRFSVANVTIKIQRAKLRIYAVSKTSDGPGLYSTGNNWNEASITWDNRPGAVGGVIDDADAVSEGSWVEYDVTPVVQGNGTYSFILRGEISDGLRASSREGSHPPQLVVETGKSVFLPLVVK